MPRAWYVYNGSTLADAPYIAANYRLFNNGNKPACVNGIQICAISAGYIGNMTPINPDAPLSNNIISYIADALGTFVAQPQVPTDSKRYVYLK